jgi:penicillin-binding protein 1C
MVNKWIKSMGKGTRIVLSLLVAYVLYLAWILPRPLFDNPLSTIVYDNEGKLMGARIAADGQWRFPQPDSLPSKYIDCILEYEDRRFYYHPGFDPLAVIGAIKHNLSSSTRRGGSTITMQVMRLAFKNNRRNIWSKVKETCLSVYLTLRYKKSTILKVYAANAPFGSNVVGLEAACWRYYGKPPHLLTWAEAATLAVLPNAPSLIHVSKNRSLLKSKRNALLQKLKERKIIDEDTYNLSIDEPLPDKPLPLPMETPHLVEQMKKMKLTNKSSVSTINREMQLYCNEIASYYQEINAQNRVNNIAILVVENESGNVLAYVGNTTANVKGAAVDMITARRSSGSILKPLLYTALLNEGKMSPQSLVPDIPLSINGYAPQNFDKTYKGALKSDEALQRSLNIPFVIKLREYGIAKFLNLTKKTGITTLTRSADNYGLSLILGGGEVTLWELCGVYSSMARTLKNFIKYQSKYSADDWHMPNLVAQEEQKHNKNFTPSMFNAGSIYACFEALKGLKRPDEEGLWEEFSSSKTIAWKTGTSFGHKDAWAIGLDAKYTVGIWVGNADGSSRANLTGISTAAPVLFDVFNRLPHSTWFARPWDDLSRQLICRQSGHMASQYCTEVDTTYINATSKEYINCPYHQLKSITADGLYQANLQCFDASKVISKPYFILPPDQVAYYKNNHPDFEDLPDYHPDCKAQIDALNGDQFAIIFPSEYTKIFIGDDVSGKAQSAIFKASHNRENGILYWHIDDEYLGKTQKYHTMEVAPKPGKHKLTIMDENGDQRIKIFEVIKS